MKSFIIVALISIFTLNVMFIGCGRNSDTKNNPQNENQSKVQSNSTTPKIGDSWNSIQKKNKELNETIEKNKLEEVHELAFSISDIVNSLPGQSTGLTSDKMDKLKSYAREVENSAALLDEYGDAGDMKNTKSNYEIFNMKLDSIKSLYPEESFK